MEKENQLIVPTQDIAFAVLKDGSRIVNFTDGGGEKPNVESMMKFFKAVADFFDTCSEKEFIAASLMYMLTSSQIHAALERRTAQMKADLKD